MTYDTIEKSVYSSEPIEIYIFDREGISQWRYTSSDDDVLVSGYTYTAIPIQRSNIENSQDIERAALNITMPASNDFVSQFISSSPTDRISVYIKRFHRNDSEVIFLWIGKILNIEHREFDAVIHCESSISSLKRPTLRRVYSSTCPYLLYDEASCRVNKTTHKLIATLSVVDGVLLSSASFTLQPSGYYSGGIVEYLHDSLYNKAFIVNHIGDTIETSLPLQGVYAGKQVDVYPGCDHSLATCDSKFLNSSNYGGFPYLPEKNPFGGSPVF